MKNALALTIIGFIFIAVSCTKKEAPQPEAQFIGKWKVSSHYFSSGGAGQWQDVPANKTTLLEFKYDGTLAGGDLATDYATYSVKDSITIQLVKKNSSETHNYRYKIENRVLTLSPAGPIFCIEGCATKYIRQ